MPDQPKNFEAARKEISETEPVRIVPQAMSIITICKGQRAMVAMLVRS